MPMPEVYLMSYATPNFAAKQQEKGVMIVRELAPKVTRCLHDLLRVGDEPGIILVAMPPHHNAMPLAVDFERQRAVLADLERAVD